MNNKLFPGQTMVELLVVVGISAVLLPALAAAFVVGRDSRPQTSQRSFAIAQVAEGLEAARAVRDQGWANIATNGTYHPVLVGGLWQLVSGNATIQSYTRSVVIASVYRDAIGTIAQSGGTLDPSSKYITSTVSWLTPRSSSVSETMILTRYKDNLSYTQTSQADFTTGTLSNVAVTNTAGGEVTLSPNNRAKWCSPSLSNTSIDLPDVPNGVYSIPGHVFAITGQTANANQESFSHVLVADTSPPTFSLHGKLKGYKTTDVFGDANWAYLATTNDSKEIVIANLNQYSDVPNKIYREEGSFNATGSTDADTVFVLGTRGYMTAGNYLYVFDLSSKTGVRSQIGSRIQFANTGDTAGGIYVRQVSGSTYAYIAIQGSTPEELKIANVTNNNNANQWKIVGSINIEPNNCSSLESGKAVYVKPDGSRAYVSSINDTTFKEFFAIDTSNKSSPSLLGGFATNPPCTNGGGYEAGGMNPEQSVVVGLTENRALLAGVDDPNDAINSEEYQILDLSDEAHPIKCGGLQFNQGIYGISAVTEADGDAYAYLVTGDSANELKVVQGGPDGNYFDNGVYQSATFDMTYARAVNRISATTTVPNNTTVRFQVAIAEPVAGSCSGANYVYVGPDGTNSTYFGSTGGVIPQNNDGIGYENPGRCLRIKSFLTTTDANITPTLSDFTINYSP